MDIEFAPSGNNLLHFCLPTEEVTSILLPIIFIPLLSSLLAGFGRYFGRSSILYLIIILLLGSVILSFWLAIFVLLKNYTYVVQLGLWAISPVFSLQWGVVVDAPAAVMLVVVTTISFLVHVYSVEYMSNDPHLIRFMSYLSLFTFFMLVLVSSNHFIGLFLGWEGIGLSSYLLIGFWFTRVQANKAALKAMIVNRVSDVTLTIGIAALYFFTQTLDFSALLSSIIYYKAHVIFVFSNSFPIVTLAALLLFIGAMGKSAQIGLHTWLPDAMEGPTPVSALIHAATLVTAGIYLLIRCSPLFECAPEVLLIIGFVGAATAFFAATAGLVQNDLKRVIAYSTCSQLGYMAFTCGMSQYTLSLFHLTNHAFFKALLFLSAGAVIHAAVNEQDMRRYGAFARVLPFSYIMLFIGSLALTGFPFLTGFYSKDLILEMGAGTQTPLGFYAWWLGLLTAFLTAFYSWRLIYMTFLGKNHGYRAIAVKTHELPPLMAIVLITLAVGSIFFGYFTRDLFVGWGGIAWSGIFGPSFTYVNSCIEGEFLPLLIKMLPFIGSCFSILLVFVVNEAKVNLLALYRHSVYRCIYSFLSNKWYFDAVYNRFISLFWFIFAYNYIFRFIDKGVLEILGPQGGSLFARQVGRVIARAQTGHVFFYAFFMFLTLSIATILS